MGCPLKYWFSPRVENNLSSCWWDEDIWANTWTQNNSSGSASEFWNSWIVPTQCVFCLEQISKRPHSTATRNWSTIRGFLIIWTPRKLYWLFEIWENQPTLYKKAPQGTIIKICIFLGWKALPTPQLLGHRATAPISL